MICIIYWTHLILYKQQCSSDNYMDQIKCVEPYFDHIMPIVTLAIDYSFNSIPFFNRHVYFLVLIVFSYGLLSFCYTKISGTEIDPIFNWNSVLGYVLPFVVLIGSVAMYFLVGAVTYLKIRKLDGEDSQILKIAEENEHKRKASDRKVAVEKVYQ
jgi:hypothetical protein